MSHEFAGGFSRFHVDPDSIRTYPLLPRFGINATSAYVSKALSALLSRYQPSGSPRSWKFVAEVISPRAMVFFHLKIQLRFKKPHPGDAAATSGQNEISCFEITYIHMAGITNLRRIRRVTVA